MRLFLVFFSFVCSLQISSAQQEWCGTKHDKLPLISSESNIVIRSVLTIPVVFHVVWYDSSENISKELIKSQLQVLNTDFRKLNHELQFAPDQFRLLSADMEIEFCFASIDPEGNITDGITREHTSVANIGSKFIDGNPIREFIKESALGGTDAWDTNRYLNVWVGKFEESTNILAISSFPWDFAGKQDGIKIDPQFIGINCITSAYKRYAYARTLTHEVGHYLGLLHPWDSMCNDQVDDTPRQSSPYYGCEEEVTYDPCGEIPMLSNFMQYGDDRCMSMFTIGQKARVWTILQSYKPALLQQSVSCYTEQRDSFLSETSIKLYPNPVTSCLMVELNIPFSDEVKMDLYDMTGKLFYTETMPNIAVRPLEIGYLPAGIYLLKIFSGNKTLVKKIMVL